MQKNDRFGKEWSSNNTNQEFPTDQQALQGLSFLGATPPSYGLHDAMFQTLDWKDNFLFDQVAALAGAYGQNFDLTVNGTRTTLLDSVEEAFTQRIATQAETEAGTSDTKFVTPQKLKGWVKQATETVLGWMKVATQAQVDAGTDDTTAVTPKKLRWGFAVNLVTHGGYIAFPSWLAGLVLQWGRVEGVTGDGTSRDVQHAITLPIAFPNANLLVLGVNQSMGNEGEAVLKLSVVSSAQVSYRLQGYAGLCDFYWLSIGH